MKRKMILCTFEHVKKLKLLTVMSWKHVYWISHIVMLGRTETIGLGEELMLTVANKLQSRR